jgi:hypothetical protein
MFDFLNRDFLLGASTALLASGLIRAFLSLAFAPRLELPDTRERRQMMAKDGHL